MFVASPSQTEALKSLCLNKEKKEEKIFYDYLEIEWRTSSTLAPNWNHIVPLNDCRIQFYPKQWSNVNRKMIRVMSMCPSRSLKTRKGSVVKLAQTLCSWLSDCRRKGDFIIIITNINVVNDRFLNAFWNLEVGRLLLFGPFSLKSRDFVVLRFFAAIKDGFGIELAHWNMNTPEMCSKQPK